MQAHAYRINVAKLENDAEQYLMTFDVENHDDIEKVLGHLQKKLPVSSAEQQAFAVGLKLFSEVIFGFTNLDKRNLAIKLGFLCFSGSKAKEYATLQ